MPTLETVATIHGPAPSHQLIRPRSTNHMRPCSQAIQLALFRRDRDGLQRVVKLGELAVKMALEGDREMMKVVFDRMDGKVSGTDEQGNDVPDLSTTLVSSLVEALVDKKIRERDGSDAKVIEAHPVEKMVERKTR